MALGGIISIFFQQGNKKPCGAGLHLLPWEKWPALARLPFSCSTLLIEPLLQARGQGQNPAPATQSAQCGLFLLMWVGVKGRQEWV